MNEIRSITLKRHLNYNVSIVKPFSHTVFLSLCVSLILSLWLRFGLFVFSFFIHSTNRRSYLSNLNLPYIVLLYPFFTLLYDNFSLPCHTFLNSDLYFPFSVYFISPFSNLSNYTMTTL